MRRVIAIVLIVLGVILLSYVAYSLVRMLLSTIPMPENPITAIPTLAMLGDPFRTTRKVKVPFHQRKRHGERNTETLFRFIIQFTFGIAFLIWLFQQLIQR